VLFTPLLLLSREFVPALGFTVLLFHCPDDTAYLSSSSISSKSIVEVVASHISLIVMIKDS
jgi:hypothetical protein